MNLASIYLNKSIACSRAIDDVETEMQSLTLLLKVDSISGKFEAAYFKSQQISVLKDSVYQRKINNNVKTTELRYENEKRQRLIEIQQILINSAKKKRALYLILLAVSLVSIVLMSWIFILKRRNYHKNKELYKKQLLVNSLELDKLQKEEEINKLKIDKFEEDLKIKERELVSIAIGIEQKNELLNLIRKKIMDSANSVSGDNHSKFIDEIVSSIKMHDNGTEDGNLFNQRFALIHGDFFSNLKKTHPALTKTELKFCAYLRIHLSGSQIANILSVTSEAIRKTRYRVRKKMNLSPEESLEEYISKF